MFDYLFQMHEVYLFALLGSVSILVSIVAVLLVSKFIPLKLRYAENPVLGNMSSFISIIYGVLAGLTALYLVNNITDTTSSVQREADAIANIYRDSSWLNDPVKTHIQKEIKVYLERVIYIEWDLMRHGKAVTHDGDDNINRISAELKNYQIKNQSDLLIMHQLLEEIKTLYNAREGRIAASHTQLNPEIWVVILLGTILTLVVNYLFGMHLYLHLVTVGAATLMAFSIVFLLLTLDRPFQGEYVLEQNAFIPVLEYVKKTAT